MFVTRRPGALQAVSPFVFNMSGSRMTVISSFEKTNPIPAGSEL